MPATQPRFVYTTKGLGKVLPTGRAVLHDVWLSFRSGARVGVLGARGAGKSTLLRIMAGEITEFDGEASAADGVTVGYLPPAPRLDPAKTVADNVEEGVAAARALLRRYDEVTASLSSGLTDYGPAMEEQGRLQEAIDAAGAWDLDARVARLKDALRLPPGTAGVTTLSDAERGRVALCRLLLAGPDLLLLDEPTNHLDARAAGWLERFLAGYPGTVVMVTHDRYFLENVAGWILEIDRGAGVPWEGNYSSWLEQKQRRLALEASGETERLRALQRELDWIRLPSRARQARGQARLRARGRPRAAPPEQRAAAAAADDRRGPDAGDVVVEAADLRKGYGKRMLIDGLSFRLPPGGIAGVVGPSGAGKTTLLRLLAGEESPDGGALRLGRAVRPSRSAGTGGLLDSAGSPEEGANLLLLDEPAGALDVDTLRALEDALDAFAGSAVVVSHDRWFLDRVATHIIAFDGRGPVAWRAGNHADYETDRRRRQGAA